MLTSGPDLGVGRAVASASQTEAESWHRNLHKNAEFRPTLQLMEAARTAPPAHPHTIGGQVAA